VRAYIASTFFNMVIKTLSYLQYFELRDVGTQAVAVKQNGPSEGWCKLSDKIMSVYNLPYSIYMWLQGMVQIWRVLYCTYCHLGKQWNIYEVYFMVTPCINNIHHFNYQRTHTTLKNVELPKHSKISKIAPTCFGLQGNHLQGAKVST